MQERVMKKILATTAVLSFFAVPALLAVPVLAANCPADMKAIDAALAKNPSLSAADMAMVKEERMKGQQLHAAGKHKESMESLAKLKKALGM
jgi:hypothetical protein